MWDVVRARVWEVEVHLARAEKKKLFLFAIVPPQTVALPVPRWQRLEKQVEKLNLDPMMATRA